MNGLEKIAANLMAETTSALRTLDAERAAAVREIMDDLSSAVHRLQSANGAARDRRKTAMEALAETDRAQEKAVEEYVADIARIRAALATQVPAD